MLKTFVTAALASTAAIAALIVHLQSSTSARVERADELLAAGKVEEARDVAASAVRAAPVEVSALRSLGLAIDKSGRRDEARKIIETAAGLSRRDARAQAWLAEANVRDGDFSAALESLDALLRQSPDLYEQLIPMAATFADDPRSAEALIEKLKASPPWRSALMRHIGNALQPEKAWGVYQALGETRARATAAELTPYFERLVRAGYYPEAFLHWLVLLSPEQLKAFDGVFDGDFNKVEAPRPMNWVIEDNAASSLTIEQAPDRPKESALMVVHDGYTPGRLALQLVVLTPGRHILSGQVYGDEAASRRLSWVVSCAENGRQIGLVSPVTRPTWSPFQVEITVPEQDCAAQWLELRPVAGDRRKRVEAWFDKIAIAPAGVCGGLNGSV